MKVRVKDLPRKEQARYYRLVNLERIDWWEDEMGYIMIDLSTEKAVKQGRPLKKRKEK